MFCQLSFEVSLVATTVIGLLDVAFVCLDMQENSNVRNCAF